MTVIADRAHPLSAGRISCFRRKLPSFQAAGLDSLVPCTKPRLQDLECRNDVKCQRSVLSSNGTSMCPMNRRASGKQSAHRTACTSQPARLAQGAKNRVLSTEHDARIQPCTFGEKAAHQPSLLMVPATIEQLPVSKFGPLGEKNLHWSQLLPSCW
jgi:hypothetical protein